jgi:hypothetical protein
MISPFEPGNLLLIFLLCVIMGIPFSIMSYAIFLLIRKIPSLVIQCLIPLVAGIIVVVMYASMSPSDTVYNTTLMFLIGILGNPLLILPPIIVMQKYLHRIPVPYAVFFTAFLASCFIIGWGALQGGEMRFDGSSSIISQSARTIITDIIAASGASCLMIELDLFLLKSEKRNSAL